MKRTLYRRLHQQARPSTRRSTRCEITAVWTAPDARVPRWSPGAGWVEVQTARMWLRPAGRGAHHALVRTWGLTDGIYNDQPVLLSGRITDYHGWVADKHHKLYQVAEPGSLNTEVLADDHPALVYQRYYTRVLDRLDEATRDAWRWMWVRVSCELHPAGAAWVCAIELQLAPHGTEYWEDLAVATDAVAAATHQPAPSRPPRVRLYGDRGLADTPTDPLWSAGWTELNRHDLPGDGR